MKEPERESNSNTETVLQESMRMKLKILPNDVKAIHSDRVLGFLCRHAIAETIVKLSAYQAKNFVKSFIKNIPKGTNIGISDDFPKKVDEVRRKLHLVLKAAKHEKKEAYFKVEKLLINGQKQLISLSKDIY